MRGGYGGPNRGGYQQNGRGGGGRNFQGGRGGYINRAGNMQHQGQNRPYFKHQPKYVDLFFSFHQQTIQSFMFEFICKDHLYLMSASISFK